MSLTRRGLLASVASVGYSASCFGRTVLGASPAPSDAALYKTFDALSDAILYDNPETATSLGVDKGMRSGLKARLSDQSWSHIAKDHEVCAAWLNKLDAIAPAGLSPAAQLDKAVVSYALDMGRDGGHFDFGANTLAAALNYSATPYVVSQQTGSFVTIPEFLDSQHGVETKADADAYLARLEEFSGVMDQETERVRRDAALGVSPPDFLLATSVGQMERFMMVPAAKQRTVSALATRVAENAIPGDYANKATMLVVEKLYPALGRQISALNAVAAKTTSAAGVWKLKNGEAYYNWLLRVGTTTEMQAKEIHALGLAQDAEISARMDVLLRKQGINDGSVGERMTALGHDPRFLYPDSDAGRAQIIDYLSGRVAAVRQKISEFSHLKLKAEVTIKRVPQDIEDGAPLGYMSAGPIDGSRPAIYYINLKNTANWPRFSLPTLTYHESLPGHVWQQAYMTESGRLPLIRIILGGFNAYIEGWALYAEQLSGELGLYADDHFGELGYLQAQKFRACRLVADTGLHAMRWTRMQTIDWLVTSTGRPRASMQSEVDRYCATPGQACGYKIGQTEINRLRTKAQSELGPKFNLAEFNDIVVAGGAVPLAVLSTVIDGYLAKRKAVRF